MTPDQCGQYVVSEIGLSMLASGVILGATVIIGILLGRWLAYSVYSLFHK